MQNITHEESGLPPEVFAHYTHLGRLIDGRICGVHRLMFHWTMHVGIDEMGYTERYCYQTQALAVIAMAMWDGTGDPEFWHKHPDSGRRRDAFTGRIWHEDDFDAETAKAR